MEGTEERDLRLLRCTLWCNYLREPARLDFLSVIRTKEVIQSIHIRFNREEYMMTYMYMYMW